MKKPQQLEFKFGSKLTVLPKTKPVPRRSTAGNSQNSAIDLTKVWENLIKNYFPDARHLYQYVCKWSPRLQRRTLASCNLNKHRIIVAQELNDPMFYRVLPPLLYHEMCHAYLGANVSQKGGKNQWHGPEFKRLEERHPEIAWLDLWIQEGGWAYAVNRHRAKRARRLRAEKVAAGNR